MALAHHNSPTHPARSMAKASLTDEQLVLLRRYSAPLEETVAQMAYMRHLKMFETTDWQMSLLLVRLLGGLDGGFDDVRTQSEIDGFAATLCHGEFALWVLNKEWVGEKLRYNPILRHWIDVVVRIQPVVLRALRGEASPDFGPVPDWWVMAQAGRLMVINWAVNSQDTLGNIADEEGRYTPEALVVTGANLLNTPIEVERLIDILESEGMYVPNIPKALPSPTFQSDQDVEPPEDVTNQKVPEEGVFYQWLHDSPNDALQWLVHLPPSLNSFDFLTKVLGRTDEFDLYELQPRDIAREQLQHSLRHVERLGASDHSEEDSQTGTSADTTGESTGGTEEQAQAIKVLVVYLRNLIAKGILPLDTVYMDVQEICVRYIFLQEVRDFRTWLDKAIGPSSVPVGAGG